MNVIKIPLERDLQSPDHDIWANAVMMCKGGNPYCGGDGVCHAGGECFSVTELTREQAILECHLLDKEVRELREKNELLEVEAMAMIAELQVAADFNAKEGNTQRVFAMRYCITQIQRLLKGSKRLKLRK